MKKTAFILVSLAMILVFSCKKNGTITSPDAQLHFSSDTLYFDTVFTNAGSVTQSVKLLNNNNGKLKLADVRLSGGDASAFKINIDGAAVSDAGGLELEANDSLYIFVSVFVNPSSASLPFILQDSILVSYNGNHQYIQLQAYGQNAHFIANREIATDENWPNDLPYVITGGLTIDSNATLTIQPGSRVYFHANAPMLIDGTLVAAGDSNARIYFQGDRLDEPYKNYPGSWPGLLFRESSKDNLLTFAVIQNAYQGIVASAPSPDANPKLTLNACVFNNIYDAGIEGIQTSIQANNCLVSNCGKDLLISYGGDYDFTNCTVAGFGNDYVAHTHPVLDMSNTLSGNGSPFAALNAHFINCIFWGDAGNVDDEVTIATQNNTGSIHFFNCLWKAKNSPAGIDTANILINTDPLFDSVNNQRRIYDFHLKPGSPAIGFGQLTVLPFDLDGHPRTNGTQTDLGCYENP